MKDIKRTCSTCSFRKMPCHIYEANQDDNYHCTMYIMEGKYKKTPPRINLFEEHKKMQKKTTEKAWQPNDSETEH